MTVGLLFRVTLTESDSETEAPTADCLLALVGHIGRPTCGRAPCTAL